MLGKDPLPTLRAVYGTVRSEELRRAAMIPAMPQESSALDVITPPTSTRENNRQSGEEDSLYCDYCHKRRHTRETCYKRNGRT